MTAVIALNARRAPSLMDHAARLGATLRDALARQTAFERTVAELSALSDRDLADIGIPRCDIRAVARDSVRGLRAA
jgi:uncharacterized protein YjiS (DUF1127 family)